MIVNNKSHIYSGVGRFMAVMVVLFFFVSTTKGQIITQQPQNTTVCQSVGGAVLEVKVNPVYPNPTYLWEENIGAGWQPIIIGGDGPNYTADQAGQYRCTVRVPSTLLEETSAIATVSFSNIPSIGDIAMPGVCNKSTLTATATGINNNGSPILPGGYRWELASVLAGSGSATVNVYVDSTNNAARLTVFVTNGCGTGSIYRTVNVFDTPPPPTVISKDYCHGETATALSIAETGNTATWYSQKTGGTGTSVAPTPNTAIDATQIWWVSQTIRNAGDVYCEGYRAKASVTVTSLSDVPTTTPDLSYCLNASNIVLSAQGDHLAWYKENDFGVIEKLPGADAPQINTSNAGTQIYYVTQTQTGKCESPKVKITVAIENRAEQQLIKISNVPSVLCPYNKVTIRADAAVPNPIFRWYKESAKNTLLHTGDSYETPILSVTTPYYVTLEYTGHCESIYPQPVMVNVSDGEKPTITAPADVVVSTNDGVCYAANVQTGSPVVWDNCTPVDQLLVYTDPVAPTDYQLGSTTITWWVNDIVNNKERAAQTITVQDLEFPQGTCPNDVEVVVNTDITSAVVDYNMSYTDNCRGMHVTRESGLASGSVFPLGETIVRHSVVDTAGNTVICQFKVIVRHPYRALEVALRVSSYEICSGQAVTVSPVVSGGNGKYTYTWRPRSWTKAVLEDYPLETTRYEVTVDDGVSSQTKSVEISVLKPNPVGLGYEGREDEILEGDEITVKATPGFASYKFLLNNKVVQEVGLSDQIVFTSQLGLYTIRVFATDANQCVAQDQLEINVESKKLPNVFTPNQDGKNEVFLEGYDLMVFSRSGELLYKGTGGWDGRHKGKIVLQGTYLYVVTRTMVNGEHRVYKGTVTIKL